MRPGRPVSVLYGTMVFMTRLDAALVERWFAGVGDSESGWPTVGVEPDRDERSELDRGAQWVTAALAGNSPPRDGVSGPGEPGSTSTLLRYLHGLAGGIAGSRAVLRNSVGVGPALPADPPAEQDAMCLVAGLLAGAAAVAGPGTAPAGSDLEPSVAQAVERAGVGAADRAVEGADLAEVAQVAAGIVVQGWAVRLPDDPAQRRRYRDRALLALLLLALEQATQPPPELGPPASCGAGPGEVTGRAFTAEVTFATYLGSASAAGDGAAELAELLARVRELGAEAMAWPTARGAAVHVHTDRPGEVIAEAYAAGMVFDLRVTSLDPR